MRLTVLNGPRQFFHEHYRGTSRFTPAHWDHLPEDSEANQLFFWFCDVSGQAGTVDNPALTDRLLHLARVYTALNPADPHEVVELVREGELPSLGRKFYGVDLSLNGAGYSLLDGWGTAEFERRLSSSKKPAGILAWLIYRHFRPKLTEAWLFPDFGTARDCLECMAAVQMLAPGAYEPGSFEPIALYSVGAETGSGTDPAG